MKALILLAKAAIGFVWLVLLINIFHPFPGVAAMALYIMTGFLFMMHGLQMLIFIGAFGDKINYDPVGKVVHPDLRHLCPA